MSAKCEYSAKYKPLVAVKRSQLNEDAFQNWVKETFTNPDLALSVTNSGTQFLSDLRVDNKNLQDSPQNIDSIRSYFVNNSTGYNNCVRDFVDNVIESAIYNKNTNKWIDATEKVGSFDALNINLFNYKLKLINRINRFLPHTSEIDIDPEDEYADEKLTTALFNALSEIDKFTGTIDPKVYEAYVILKNFNKLIAEKVPYISLRKEYETTTSHGVNMYVYSGPNVKHRVSFTTNEHISAVSQYSDLALALLNYLPEWNGTSPIKGTSIGRDGFVSVMNKFKTALFYSEQMSYYRTKYLDGKFDILEALKGYLSLVKRSAALSGGFINQAQITTQINKLQGIIHYIFDSDLSEDVKEMFKGMFEKTVPLSYMTYKWQNGEFGAINLVDSYVNTQQLNLQDIVNGRVYQFRKNPSQFTDLLDKWGIKIDLSEDLITIRPKDKNVDISISGLNIKAIKNYITYEPKASGTISDENLSDLIADVLGLFLPTNDYTDISKYVNHNGNLLNDFLPLLTMTLVAGDSRTNPGTDFKPLTYRDTLNFKTGLLFTNFEPAAKVMSILYGSETRNVVNDINGNHLPTNGLTAMIFNSPKLAAEMGMAPEDGYDDPFEWNPLCLRKSVYGTYGTPSFGQPIIRQGIKIGGKTKSVSTLELSELLEVATIYDFYDSINKGDTIYLQNTNVADKERQFIIPYLLKDVTVDGKTYKMGELIKSVVNGGNTGEKAKELVIEFWQKLRNHRYTAIANNIVKSYIAVYGETYVIDGKTKTFRTLKDVDEFLLSRKVSVDTIRKEFRAKGVAFKDEIQATTTNDIARANEVLLHYLDAFSNVENAKKRLARSRAYFANDLFKTRTKINRYTNDVINKNWNKILPEWKEKRGNIETGNIILFKVYDASGKEIQVSASDPTVITNPKYRVVLNPILEGYLLADIIYSNEYNQIHVGDVFAHPTKKKSGSIEENEWGTSAFYDESEASRLVAQNKRAVIYGGAIHSFQHDLDGNRGVAKKINIAIMQDIPAAVWNMIGGLKGNKIDDEIDSMDGSGIQSIYEAILEQESLKDAAAGQDEKTILGWNDKYFGRQILLKWAVYALTNERRRLSRNSSVSGENLFRKMHSRAFDKNLDMQQLWKQHIDKDIYIRDFESRKHYKILGVSQIQFADGTFGQARTCIECNSNGDVNPNAKVQYLTNRNKIVDRIDNKADVVYNTLYDLDQFFGGAYEESLENGVLKYTTRGNYIVTDIICEENLKDHFVAYVVNKSAVKVGTENLNDTSIWYNDTGLDTTVMSTEYGGLQMNAEHELEDSEVREMTQMISALMEKGFSYDLVKQIYSDIGDVVIESLKPFKTAIKNYKDDPTKLKTLIGKALIEAYAKGDRDTLGLAQAFLAKAERMLRDGNVKFSLPFSGATINPSFIATVASLLTKRGIRRKYSGIAAVLTPSYDMIQVYGDGKTLEKHADFIAEWRNSIEGIAYRHTSIDSLINDVYVVNDFGETVRNPFIQLDRFKNFTFEDTIIVEDLIENPITHEKTSVLSEPIVINSYELYDKYKHYNGNIYVFTSRPRNLRASNTTCKIGPRTYSVYDFTATRAANYSILKAPSVEQNDVIFKVLGQAISIYQDQIDWNTNIDPQQEEVTRLVTAIANKNRVEVETLINLRKTLYNIVQKQLRDLSNLGILNDVELTGGNTIEVRDVQVEAAEIVMGKLFAKQFGLSAGDDVQDILSRGSDFFYERISGNYREPIDVPYAKYDAIIYTKNGEKLLVKIDPNLEYNFDKALNPNITKVDGKVYLNSEELCDANDKEFYQIQGDNGIPYNVIVLKSTDDYYDLVNSNQIVQHKINYNGNSEIAIQLTLDASDSDEFDVEFNIDGKKERVSGTYTELLQGNLNGTISKQSIVTVMKMAEDQSYEKRLRRQAERMAESFKLSLNFVGTRIPAQAMQSFQPMKIVAFTDSETNDVYVNRHNTYLEGSDYDIDKSYILGYEVNEDGLVETGSKLARQLGIEKALSLEIAKGREFQEGSGFRVSNELLRAAVNGDVDALNTILKQDSNLLNIEGPDLLVKDGTTNLSQKEINKINAKRRSNHEWRVKRLLKMLKLHESSYVSEAALKNRVVHGIRKVALDPKNQLNLNSPVSMASQQVSAEKSELSKDEATINIDTPSSKYMMQQQNMVGKQCIGITAVAIKTFFAKSAYYNEMLSTIPGLLLANQDAAILGLLNSLVIKNPITGGITLLSNVNVIDTIERISRNYLNIEIDSNNPLAIFNENGTFNLKRCLKYLQKQSNRVDCALELSGLLSSATDNAKELLLAKINATSRFIDIYTVALQCGATFDEISDIMTSPIFNAVSRVVSNNIFKTYEGSYRLEKIINFYLNEKGYAGILPGVKINLLRGFIANELGLKDGITDERLQEVLADTNYIETLIGKAYGKVETANKMVLSEDGYEIESGITQNDWLCIANFLEEVVDRNKTKARLRAKYGDVNYMKQIDNLKKVRDLFIPAAEEQNILGRILGINQGLDTSGYKLYQNVWYIEDFISRKIGQEFNLMEFLSNDEYRTKMIDTYEKHKVITNILDVVSKVPHFREMFNLLYDNDFMLRNLSARYSLTQDLAKKLSPKYALKENEYKQVGYYINDLFLMSYLTSTNKSFIIPRDVWYYPKGNKKGTFTSDATPVKLDDLFSLASFKSYMENYVIPAMQNGKYRYNGFISNLTRTINTDRVTGEERSYYKLPLNMSTIDQSVETKEQYERILQGFNDISNDTFEGWKIADLFFVYNAIVNKDGFGQNSMTRLFEDLVNESTSSTMVSKYYEFISKIDETPKLRNEFLKSVNEDDVRAYIKARVPGTYIQSNVVWDYGFDFTFRMPSLLGMWLANKPKVDSYVENISSYSYGITNRSVLETLAQSLFSKYGKDKFRVVSQEWIDKPNAYQKPANFPQDSDAVKTSPAFIHDGIVYINSSRASVTDVLHEYTHLVLAALKFNPKYQDVYYKLMDHIREHPNYNTIAEWYKTQGFVGTDLDEEVFAKVLQEYFNNRIADSVETDIIISNEGTILDALNEVLGTNISGQSDLLRIMNSSPREIIRRFGSSLFNLDPSIELTQQAVKWRIATQSLRIALTKGEDAKVKVKCD